jgi:hypothetical protein
MIVLCGNPECSAVLRVGTVETLVDVTLKQSDAGDFFTCPRCGISTLAADPPGDSARAYWRAPHATRAR